jgi:hypothetical protein
MRRREVIAGLGSAATWPMVARAQQAGKVVRIGFLGSASPSDLANQLAVFKAGLRDLGYIEGGNIIIEYRWAEGVRPPARLRYGSSPCEPVVRRSQEITRASQMARLTELHDPPDDEPSTNSQNNIAHENSKGEDAPSEGGPGSWLPRVVCLE